MLAFQLKLCVMLISVLEESDDGLEPDSQPLGDCPICLKTRAETGEWCQFEPCRHAAWSNGDKCSCVD